ncbi:Ig-like domain-containing protein [Dyella subtropica]|uniref:Ig-like domain-containing protein n=1 Tax=Dyella subtropica TaxID=2992127 RepID=UPI00225BA8C7|nr:Ig-like domain-containing protein [Dyella subtropica]
MELKTIVAGSLMAAGVFVFAPVMAGTMPDHEEFEAALHVPFNAAAARPITLQFSYPGAGPGTPVAWQVDVLNRSGAVLRSWQGQGAINAGRAQANIAWDGRDRTGQSLAAGYYTVRMRAIAVDNDVAARIGTGLAQNALQLARTRAPQAIEEQLYDVKFGTVAAPHMPSFTALHHTSKTTGAVLNQSVPVGGLPYTIFYGNLHSQTNHSDGGGVLSTCVGAQNPQSGAYGPADAYQYALNEGLDILMTSEHNHMYDGSTGTNPSANPATAHNLYQSGLQAASTFNSAHSNFLAVYGLEWGVISNGGHLNIFNTPSLLEWEYNSSGQLIGDIFTAKSDYGTLYTLMNTNGWVGQFNHPASSGQFNVGGTDLAYTADGDQVMALAEVLNSSAFSSNTTETETSRTSYEPAYNILLERGYHVAPTSDQDNHCANWGASYTNRTGVLIPNGTALSLSSFLDALRARRVFATEDKTGQIVLTANGNLMGQRFNNSGALTLTVNYASSAGHTAQRVQVFEGVPGSNGTVTETSQTATTTITPANGDHFYYAKITQEDGNQLWSAPVWVTEGPGGGNPPSVSASESGTSGSITLSANATDPTGITKVEFYVDNVLKSTLTASPYQTPLDSTTLSNGSHTLIAKAYDPANNVGTSSAVSFNISNTTGGTPTVSASETGTSGTITLSANATDPTGITKVEFYVDNVLKSTLTASPYQTTLDSTTLSNGSHTLIAKAYDPANNVGTSSAVSFNISNTTGGTPTVSASESGTSGTITLSANATDPTGITKVEFYVDSALSGTVTAAPYQMSLDSTKLANGTHSLIAKAYDPANNVGTSSTVSFSVSNSTGGGGTELIQNNSFESGIPPWTQTTGVISNDASEPAHTGSWKAWLDGYGTTHTDYVRQKITIPATATKATLDFFMHIDTAETTTTTAYDKLSAQVINPAGQYVTLQTWSNLDAASGYVEHTVDLSAYIGQTIQINFYGTENATNQTSFVIDDVSVKAQ